MDLDAEGAYLGRHVDKVFNEVEEGKVKAVWRAVISTLTAALAAYAVPAVVAIIISAVGWAFLTYLDLKEWIRIFKGLFAKPKGKHTLRDGFSIETHSNDILGENNYVGTVDRSCGSGNRKCGPGGKHTKLQWSWTLNVDFECGAYSDPQDCT
jgi:hypothetical protein